MFNFFKKFNKEPKKQKFAVPFSVFEEWFDKKAKEKTDAEIHEILGKIDITAKTVQHVLKNISNTKPETPEEQLPAVEEHIKKYVSVMNAFLNEISNVKDGFEAVIRYDDELSAAVNQMQSLKVFAVIKEIYREEARDIEASLSDLAESERELNELISNDSGINFILGIKEKIKHVKRKQKQVAELQQQLNFEMEKQQNAENYKLKLETDIDNLKTSEEYKRYDILLSRRIAVERDVEKEKNTLTANFAVLNSALKAYSQQSFGIEASLARKYADDVSALYDDSDLAINHVLRSISSQLQNLEADEKKREKVNLALSVLSADFLKQKQGRGIDLARDLREVQRQIAYDNTTRKIEDIKYKHAHVLKQMKSLEEDKQQCEDAIDKLAVNKDIEDLENEVSSFIEVKLS